MATALSHAIKSKWTLMLNNFIISLVDGAVQRNNSQTDSRILFM